MWIAINIMYGLNVSTNITKATVLEFSLVKLMRRVEMGFFIIIPSMLLFPQDFHVLFHFPFLFSLFLVFPWAGVPPTGKQKCPHALKRSSN